MWHGAIVLWSWPDITLLDFIQIYLCYLNKSFVYENKIFSTLKGAFD